MAASYYSESSEKDISPKRPVPGTTRRVVSKPDKKKKKRAKMAEGYVEEPIPVQEDESESKMESDEPPPAKRPKSNKDVKKEKKSKNKSKNKRAVDEEPEDDVDAVEERKPKKKDKKKSKSKGKAKEREDPGGTGYTNKWSWFGFGRNENAQTLSTRDVKLDSDDRITYRARDYCDINIGKPKDYFSASKIKIKWGRSKDYNVLWDQKVGRGAFGDVFLAHRTKGPDRRKKLVVKVIKKEREVMSKIQIELQMLDLVRGGPNIITLLDIYKEPRSQCKHLVFEYARNPPYKAVYQSMSANKARRYLYNVLVAINYAHSLGIMHRDIKPGNVMYDPSRERVRVIDWGFGEFYKPGKKFTKWPGTRSYKAPEMFAHWPYYDYGVDMWSFGVMAGMVLLRRKKMFPENRKTVKMRGEKDNWAQLEGIVMVLGTEGFIKFCAKYNVSERFSMTKMLPQTQGTPIERLARKSDICDEQAVDLLERLFEYDHEKRITSREALEHPYFDAVRQVASSYESDVEEGDGEDDDEESGSGSGYDGSEYSNA